MGRVARAAGVLPQEPQIHTGLTVLQNVAWFRAAYRLPDARAGEALMEQLGFAAHRHALVETLSGGTRQKLNLALALMHDPEVILLDEPYQGFDWETYLQFWEIADGYRAHGRTIVVISTCSLSAIGSTGCCGCGTACSRRRRPHDRAVRHRPSSQCD